MALTAATATAARVAADPVMALTAMTATVVRAARAARRMVAALVTVRTGGPAVMATCLMPGQTMPGQPPMAIPATLTLMAMAWMTGCR
jgi:hypothetical protein